jgi:hypothetical protein
MIFSMSIQISIGPLGYLISYTYYKENQFRFMFTISPFPLGKHRKRPSLNLNAIDGHGPIRNGLCRREIVSNTHGAIKPVSSYEFQIEYDLQGCEDF